MPAHSLTTRDEAHIKMDQNLTILIHPRTKRPKSQAAPDPFREDIKSAFVAYTTSLASRVLEQPPAAAPTPTSNLIHLSPPPQMLPSGCWCSDASKPSPHSWKTCPRWVPQPIVSSTAQPAACTHSAAAASSSTTTLAESDTEPEHLFCFDPAQAATDYIAWFTHIPGPPETPLAEDAAARLGDWLREHYASAGRDEFPSTEAEARAHLALLSRVFVELRGEPPGSKRLGGWYDAERVHALLRWGDMEVQACMDLFLPWIRYAKMQRVSGQGQCL